MRSKILLALLFLLIGAKALAGPLTLLEELGKEALSLFKDWEKKRLFQALREKDFERALSACQEIPKELTWALRERLGSGQVSVRLFSLNYVDVANAPPPVIAQNLAAMETEKALEGKVFPRIVIEEDRGLTLYAYVVPLLNGEGCLVCHSKGGAFSAKIKSYYPEFHPRKEKVGDLRGALVIYLSPEALKARRPSRFSSSP